MILTPPFVAAMIVPTGVGASIGGFAGDATPHMNLLAAACDVLITHPNVANAAGLQKLPENALYVEGYGLDQFMQGRWHLKPVRANKIGVVFDAGIDEGMRILHLNTLNAVRTVYGLDVIGSVITDEPVRTRLEMNESGSSSGSLQNPEVLLNACRTLIDQGATAIALCCRLPENSAAADEDYWLKGGVDPIGGLEAILSHLVVSELGLPCAHAPVFSWEEAEPLRDTLVDPRAAAEAITPTYLPCVLTGLQKAPQFVPAPETAASGSEPLLNNPLLQITDLSALVVPAYALGGLPVLAALEKNIPVIAVGNNRTVLEMTVDKLSGLPEARRTLIRTAASYEEATGILLSIRLGLSLPERTGLPALQTEPKTASPLKD